MHSGIQQRHQQLDQRRTAAAEALGQDIGAEQQHGPRFSFAQRLAHPTGVAMHQIGLQLGQVFIRNSHVGEFAEAGVDSINRLSSRQNLLNQCSALGHAGQGGWRNGHRTAGEGNSFNLGQRQRLSIQNQAIF
jgi:hypothetical protein